MNPDRMPPENIRTKTIFDFDGMAQSTRLIARLLVVVAALAILFIRMPVVFIHPAFWAEDGAAYFQFSYLGGWKSISYETAGYLTLIQWLVANFSARFPVSTAPAMFLLAATVLTLIVVWLITSPRLSLPAKPLLALTVVIVPAGYEVLGTLANVQWITPIGAFAILLMRPSKSQSGRRVCILCFGCVVDGPISLLLLPVCGLQIILNRGDTAARRRILILTGIVAIGATMNPFTWQEISQMRCRSISNLYPHHGNCGRFCRLPALTCSAGSRCTSHIW